MRQQRCSIIFKGRVQGVGFRFTAAAVVRNYPVLTGWVRNQSDGSVQMLLEGPRAEIEACLSALRQRMQHNITAENSSWSEATGENHTFSIRY